LLRRRGTPAGGLALLCVVLAVPAHAATPAPDPPPEAVAPEAPPVTRTQPAPARTAPVSTPRSAPVIHRAAPVTRAQPVQKPAAKPKPVVKPKPTKRATVTKRTVVPASADPHDRGPVPLAAFVPTVEELNRGLAAFAGLALAFVALGGAVVLVAARRELAR
jgi:outer membrane biosynthesis protein TonB